MRSHMIADRKPSHVCWVAGATLAVMAIAHDSRAADGVTIEAIDVYPSCTSLHNNVANATNFRTTLLSNQSLYKVGTTYFNSDVISSDFIESWDSQNFDRQTNLDAIAYFSGHGQCDDQFPGQACTTTANCTNPPAGAPSPGICLRSLVDATPGRCSYNVGRKLKANGCALVNLTTSAHWGESPVYGAWAGVGVDGGVNFVVLDISCGVTPSFWSAQYQPVVAGVATIATIMPTSVGSDTFDTANRGSSFAQRYKTNPNSPIAWAWRDAINSTTGGWACFLGGGGHGVDGCGANLTFSADVNPYWSQFKADTETWVQNVDDLNDAYTTASRSIRWQCNYDCAANPWTL
jgi:hypothetical protein